MARLIAAKPKKPPRNGKAVAPAPGAPHIRTFRSAMVYLGKLANLEQLPRVEYNSKNFSVARMGRLLGVLGHPERRYRVCHLAGTKGKGSTATMLTAMLAKCGYRVGLFTSPHLLSVRERICVGGEMITEQQFTRGLNGVIQACQRARITRPTYFEVITALGFQHFADAEVDFAVIETGLGGRLDSTNVVQPEVCGITSISIDHVAQLGSSLTGIAEEKAGIIKEGVPVISAPQRPEVKGVLRRVAEARSAPIRFAGEDGMLFSFRFESSQGIGPHTRLSLTTQTSRFEHIHVPLLGDHQAINCALALGMMDALKSRGVAIDDQLATDGLAGVSLAGRMEVVHEDPRILVDGAHNAASVEALMRAIGQNVPYDSMVVIFGCHRDKDVAGMLRHIQLGADKVIFTSTGSPRSIAPADLAARFGELCGKMAQVAEDVEEALHIAQSAVDSEDLICVTGSFVLVGRVKRLFGAVPGG
ncbi:MAG: bifunctional folylpolyglutamate synthase/dihydrofolate synthase [Planctomycetes bacterium]|nr:bifunctional folylpolyglutamate synthase/dihydrofolate synthase [Planctomycetota bacterium]